MSGYFINLQYYPENDPANVTSVTGLTGIMYTITGLQPITTYNVSAIVVSSGGNESAAVEISVTTGQLAELCYSPLQA